MVAKKTASKKVARKAAKKAKGKGTKKCPIMDESDPFVVWVSWEYTHCSGGDICDGEEDEDYPQRETEYKDHKVHGVFMDDSDSRGWSRHNEREAVTFEPVTGAEVFVVAVTYGDGDSFGSSSGNVQIVGVYDDEEIADAIAKNIRADDSNSDRYGNVKKGKKEHYTGYKAWTGYFESLEGVEVHRLRLDEDSGVKRF